MRKKKQHFYEFRVILSGYPYNEQFGKFDKNLMEIEEGLQT